MEKKLFNSILILLCFVLISCGKDEEKTKEAIDEEGWLHTGTICKIKK